MSAHKHIDRICIAVTLCAVLLTILFMNGEALGLTMIVDADAERNAGNELFTANDLDGDWDDAEATAIVLNGGSAKITGNGAYCNGGSVYITNGGRYTVSGTLDDGSIVVDAYQSSKVWIMLDGADIACSNDAAFRVDQADKVFLTLKEGSTNSLTSGAEYSEEALAVGTGGAVYSHDDLTVNDSGSLTITAEYGHGIECNDELVITGGEIDITCPQDGLNANDSIRITGADLTVTAGDDGIHCDTEIIIADGTIRIEECYEGIEAPDILVAGGDITIYPSDDGFNANGGTDSFGMGGGGFGGGFGGGGFGGTGPAGGDTSGDGNGGPVPSVTAGTEETAEEALSCITITGGDITIINETGRDADGLDSNGDILISGGNIRVSLVNSGSNSAIDYGSENGGVCEISGGTVIACGSYSMAEAFDATSAQCSVLYNFSDGAEAGTTFAVEDTDGNTLISWEVPCSFSSVNVSIPELEIGNTYQIVIGDGVEEITLEEVSASYGDAASTMFGGSMNWGGMMRRGGRGGAEMIANGNAGTEDAEGEAFGRGGHGGQRMGGRPDGMNSGEMPELPEGMEPGEMPELPEGMESGDMPDGMRGQHEAGDAAAASSESSVAAETAGSAVQMPDAQQLAEVLACAVVLAAGILFAWKYRKHA